MSCGCVNSKGQEAIKAILVSLNVPHDTEVWFGDLIGNSRPLRFDFSINDVDGNILCLIEFQGKQHYQVSGNESFGKQQREQTDSLKKEYCKENNILLYEIKYDDDIIDSINTILEALHVNPVPSCGSDAAEGQTTRAYGLS